MSSQKVALSQTQRRQREPSSAFALFFMLAGLFGALLAIHYLQPDRPPVDPPGSRSP